MRIIQFTLLINILKKKMYAILPTYEGLVSSIKTNNSKIKKYFMVL